MEEAARVVARAVEEMEVVRVEAETVVATAEARAAVAREKGVRAVVMVE